jgi:hypothetical protein
MDVATYVARQVDGVIFELLPDGTLCIWEAGNGAAPVVLSPKTTYALYLLLRTPGIPPALRSLDDDRQRQAWERRSAA